ncbi:hypothetical protein RUW65_27050, partial [Klebsiella pneumoniae]|nr:hypothetical protein [Klebsiella pneumoniae]
VPAKDCRHSAGQRRFAPALFVVAAGACSFPLAPYHPFESIRREGVNEHGPVQMSGGEREIFFGLMKRQRNGREKFIAKGSAV